MFPDTNKIVYTVLNEQDQSVEGELLKVIHKKDCHYVELLGHREIKYEAKDGEAALFINLAPKEVICLAQFPEILHFLENHERIVFAMSKKLEKVSLKLIFIKKTRYGTIEEEERSIEVTGEKVELMKKEVFEKKADKVVIQLFEGRFLIDELIIEK